MKDIIVIIACDCDPDRPRYNGMPYNSRKRLVWRGITKGISNAKKIANNFEDSYGENPKFTWFVRSDDQIKEIYGDYAWQYKRFSKLWKGLEKNGDEIGWHPHLWKWSKKYKIWYQEVANEKWIESCLRNGYYAIPKIFKPKSTRMGWNFHNNLTIKILSQLNILVDLSALPNMSSNRCINDIKLPCGVYDWIGTSETPYFPSLNDYKISSKEILSILEVPLTCFEIPFWFYMLRILFRKRKIKRYEAEIAKHPFYFKSAVKKVFKNGDLLVSYFHPDELLVKNGLFSYNNFRKNLEMIFKASKKYNRSFTFLTAKDIASEH